MESCCLTKNDIFDLQFHNKMSNISRRVLNKLNKEIPGAAKILANRHVEPIHQSSDVQLNIVLGSYTDVVLDSFSFEHNDEIVETLTTLAMIMMYLDAEEIAINRADKKITHNIDSLYKSSVEFYNRKYPTQSQNLSNLLLLANTDSIPWTVIFLAILVMFTAFCGALFSFAYSSYSCN